MVKGQDSDLPLLDLRAAREDLRGPVTNRPNLLLTGAHGLPGLPRTTAIQRPDCLGEVTTRLRQVRVRAVQP